jgi:proteic killer suppression protein
MQARFLFRPHNVAQFVETPPLRHSLPPLDTCYVTGYTLLSMIKSFQHKGLERFFLADDKSGIQPTHAKKLRLILTYLDAANDVGDMALPGLGLHSLKGDYAGFWAVKVSGNWRLIFQFEGAAAYLVNYLDYH